jgi:hypothetical protein
MVYRWRYSFDMRGNTYTFLVYRMDIIDTPEKFAFEPGESMRFEVRKHWLLMFIEACGFFFAALAPLCVGMVLLFLPAALPAPALIALALCVYAAYLLILWVGFFTGFTMYYLDVWVVTDRRLIDFDQHALFSRTTTALRLENIQDVQVSVSGIVFTFLKIGRIHVQTAGAVREFHIRYAHKPEETRQRILELVAQRRDELTKSA